MARPLWSGSISFGLVNIPVKLFPAVHEKNISFHLLSADGSCRLRRKLVCPETGKEYDFNETALGYEVAPDQYIIVDREELNSLKPESGRIINIETFVKLDDIDPIYFDRAYYLAPDERGTKAYKLLYEAMKNSDRVAIGRFVMRNHEYLAALRIIDDIIGLETMHYEEEIDSRKEMASDIEDVPVAKKELSLAQELIGSLTEKFSPGKYKSTYQEELKEMLDAKAKGKAIVSHEPAVKTGGKVVDIMDALKKSLQEKQSAKKEHAKTKSRTTAGGHHQQRKRTANTKK